jgi:hypothetical protein
MKLSRTTTTCPSSNPTRARARAREAEIWRLDFRAEGDGPPVELRIRALLKRALRSHGLRCVDYARSPGPAIPTIAGGAGAAAAAITPGDSVGASPTMVMEAVR